MASDATGQPRDPHDPADPPEAERVYEPPSFDDLKWPPERVYTYAQLYGKLVRQCSHEEAWGRAWRFLLYMAIPLLLLGILISSSPEGRWYAIWNAIIGFLLAALVLSVIFTAWLLSQNTAESATALAARLIAVTRSPRTGRQGLGPLDLRRLSRTATIEQQAADWRGSVVTTVIIALVLTAFTAAAREVTLETVTSIVAIGKTVAASPLPGFLTNVTYLVVPAYVGFNLFQYFRRFTVQEISNRIIQLATADALAALEDCGLDAASSLEFRQKRIAIKRLGYQLSPEPLSYSWKSDFMAPDYDHKRDPTNGWHVEPLAPKTQPYPIDVLLVFLSILPMMYVAWDNAVYSTFLGAQARIRQSSTKIVGAEVRWPSRRNRDDDER